MLFIFVTNMKHLPKNPPPLTRLSSQPVPQPSDNLATSTSLSSTPTSITLLQADHLRSSSFLDEDQLSQNGVGKKHPHDIQLLQTDALIKEVTTQHQPTSICSI